MGFRDFPDRPHSLQALHVFFRLFLLLDVCRGLGALVPPVANFSTSETFAIESLGCLLATVSKRRVAIAPALQASTFAFVTPSFRIATLAFVAVAPALPISTFAFIFALPFGFGHRDLIILSVGLRSSNTFSFRQRSTHCRPDS